MDKTLKVVISAEVAKLKKGISDAKAELKHMRTEAEQQADKIDKAFADAGTGIKDGLGKAAGIFAGLGAAALGTAAATEEYRVAQAKLNAAFDAAGAPAGSAKQTYTDLYKVLGDDQTAVEAANHIAKLTTNQEEMSEWTNICQGVYATFGDSLPIEGLTEAANETAKVGTVTGSLADALNWAGVNEDEFNEKLAACNDEADREKLIRETLSGLYDEAATKYGENAGAIMEQREAQAELQSTLASLGEAMTPVLTAFTNFASQALQPVADKIKSLAEEYGPALSEAMGAAGEAVGKAFGFFVDNWAIIASIAGVIGGIAAAIGLYNAVAAVKAAMDAAQVTTLSALIAVEWASVSATVAALAPYLLIVAAIAAVIAIIVICVQHWDEIVAAVKGAWDSICKATQSAVDGVVKFFQDLWSKITSVVGNIVSAVSERFNAIKTAMGNAINNAKTTVLNIFNAIKTTVSNVVNAIKTVVSNVFNAVKTAISTPINAAKAVVTSVFNGIKSTISGAINGAKNAVKTAINAIKGFLNFKWSLPKLKLPHLSIEGKLDLFASPPQIPKVGISWYARGGVFDKPALFPYGNGSIGGLGEAGAEAIVPLEKNTQWLDKIAERLGAGRSGNLILEVDGKVFGQVALDTINANTKQAGRLGLRLV